MFKSNGNGKRRLMRAFAATTLAAALAVAAGATAFAEPTRTAEQAAADGLPTASATATADPVTQDSWNRLLVNTRTEYVGNFWTDKSVTTDAETVLTGVEGEDITVKRTEGATFLTDLSALSSSLYSRITSDTPLDIVLVVDVSSSMGDGLDGSSAPGSQSKLDMTKDALKDFVDVVVTQNGKYAGSYGEAGLHRVALVKYSGQEVATIGDGFSGGGLNYTQVVSGFTYYTQDGAKPADAQSEAYADASSFASTVDALRASGSSRADLGLKLASDLYAGAGVYGDGAREGAERVVVFLAGGNPTDAHEFDATVATQAVQQAYGLKRGTGLYDKAVVYAVGLFPNASTEASAISADTDEGRLNGFINAVSSAYPAAQSYEPTGLGPREESGTFLFAPETAADLANAYRSIAMERAVADEGLPVSTGGGGGDGDNPVLFVDTLGPFMEVKDVNGIVYGTTAANAKLYAENDGNGTTRKVEAGLWGTTYTFDCEVEPVVTKGNPDRDRILSDGMNLSQITITVYHSEDPKIGDSIEVSIPARLVPLVEYEVSNDELGDSGRVYSLSRTDVRPIHLFYSSGLKEEALNALQPDALAKQSLLTTTEQTDCYKALVDYVREHNDGDNALLYANRYTGNAEDVDADTGRTVGDTFAQLLLSDSNSYYYFTRDTPLYYDAVGDRANPQWVLATTESTGLSEVTPDLLDWRFSYVNEYYDTIDGVVTPVREHIRLDEAGAYSDLPAIESADSLKLEDGVFYVKKGTVENYHRGHLDAEKQANPTNTASMAFKGRVSYGQAEEYLGNNGLIATPMPGTVVVSKAVETAPGESAPEGAVFAYKLAAVEMEDDPATPDVNEATWAAEATYWAVRRDADGNALDASNQVVPENDVLEKAAFSLNLANDQATFTMRANETVTIAGIPSGATWKVEEQLTDVQKTVFTTSVALNVNDDPVVVPQPESGEAASVQGKAGVASQEQATFTSTFKTQPIDLAGANAVGAVLVMDGRPFKADEDDLQFGLFANATAATPLATGTLHASAPIAGLQDRHEGVIVFEPTSLYDSETGTDGTLTFHTTTTDDAVYYLRQMRPTGDDVTTDGQGRSVKKGVAYDNTVYGVNVSVVIDPETGALTPHYTFSRNGENVESAVFHDEYNASVDDVHIDLTETLFGRALRSNGAVRFTLENMGEYLLDVNGQLVYAKQAQDGTWERADADEEGAQPVKSSEGDLSLRRSSGIALSNPAAAEGQESAEFSFSRLSYDSATLRAAVDAHGTALGDNTVVASNRDEETGLRTYTVSYHVRQLYDEADVLGGYEASYDENGNMTIVRASSPDGKPDNGLYLAEGYADAGTVNVRLRDKGDGTFAVTYVYGGKEYGADADLSKGGSRDAEAAGSALRFGLQYTPAPCEISEAMILTYPYTLSLVGRSWLSDDKFTFSLVSTGANAAVTPMPGGEGNYSEATSSAEARAQGQSETYRVGVTTPVVQPTEESEKRFKKAMGDAYKFNPNVAHFGWKPTTYTQEALVELDAQTGSPVPNGTHVSSREFSWLLTWNPADKPGITPDAHLVTASAVAVDDLEGAIYVVPSVSLTAFTHTYTASARFAGLTISKTLTGRDLIENTYAFEVQAQDTTDETLKEGERATAKQAAAKAAQGEPAVNKGELTVWNDYEVASWHGDGEEAVFSATDLQTFFNGLQFTQDDLSNGDGTYADKRVFTYTVSEVQGDKKGYTYDKTVYTVAITVEDDPATGTLKLSADVSAVDGEGKPIQLATTHYPDVSVGSGGSSVPVSFAGAYEATVEYDLETGAGDVRGVQFTKRLEGASRSVIAGEFEFSLNLPGNVVVTKGKNAAAADGSAANVDFDPIAFSVAGLEQQRRDAPTRVHREQRNDDTGAITYLARYAPNEDDSTFAQAGLSKRHVPAGVEFTLEDNGAGELKVTKVTAADREFVNYNGSDSTQVEIVGTVNLKGSRAGGLNDNEFSFQLEAQNSASNNSTWRSALEVPLKASSTTASSVATADTVSDVTFGPLTFTVEDMANSNKTESYQEEFDRDVDGVSHHFGRTTYTYRVHQLENTLRPGVQLDTDTYDYVDVVLTYDVTAKKLSATVRQSSDDANDHDQPSGGRVFRFDNEYTVVSLQVSPTATAENNNGVTLAKEMSGRNLVPGRLKVDIYDNNGKLVTQGIIKVSSEDPTKGVFDVPAAFTFSQSDVRAGRITYRVREHEEFGEAALGRTYDTNVYALAAELTDNGNGTAKVEWSLTRGADISDGGKKATFHNSYDSKGAITPSVFMRMVDHDLIAGGFTFSLYETKVPNDSTSPHDAPVADVVGEPLASVVNSANGEGQTTSLPFRDLSYGLNTATDGALLLEGNGGMVERGVAQKHVNESDGSIDYRFTYKVVQGGVTLDRMPNVNPTTGAEGYAMDVTLHEAGTGTMTATVSYHELNKDGTRKSTGADVNSALFVDTFKPNPKDSSPTGSGGGTEDAGQHITLSTALTGRSLKPGEFTYALYEGVAVTPGETTPVATGTNDDHGNVVLSPVTFTSASRVVGGVVQPSVFTLMEYHAADSALPGVYYDCSMYRIQAVATELTAADPDDGTLVPTGNLKIDWSVVAKSPDSNISSSAAVDETHASFQNRYTPNQASVYPTTYGDDANANVNALDIRVKLTGRPMAQADFRADLYDKSDIEQNTMRPKQGATPVAFGHNGTVENGDGYKMTLEDGNQLAFTAAGTYEYTLVQHVPAGATWAANSLSATYRGVTYDLKSYDVYAVVTDDQHDANLKVKWYVGAVSDQDDATQRPIVFENSYTAADCVVSAQMAKRLTGRAWTDDKFSFTLTADEGSPLPAGGEGGQTHYTVSEPNAASAASDYFDVATFSLGDMTMTSRDLDNAGAEWVGGKRTATFGYTVKEDLPKGVERDSESDLYIVDGTIYDTRSVRVKLAVTDGGAGKLSYSVVYEGAETDEYAFVNRYDVTEEYEDSFVQVSNMLEGRGVMEAEDFQFRVTPVASQTATAAEAADRAHHPNAESWLEYSPKPDKSDPIESEAEVDFDLASFQGMRFSATDAGKTFSYQLQLENYGRMGYTFDGTVYRIDLTVADSGEGYLVVTTLVENVATENVEDLQESEAGDASPASVEFSSSYEASGRADVPVRAVLSGRALQAGEFSFELYREGDNELLSSATNAAANYSAKGASGRVQFQPFTVTLAELREATWATYDNGEESGENPSYKVALIVYQSWLYNRDNTGNTTLRDRNIARATDDGFENDDITDTKAMTDELYEAETIKSGFVRFTDDGSGGLTASYEFESGDEEGGASTQDEVVFENKYLPSPVTVDMSKVPFSVQLVGRTWGAGLDFDLEFASQGFVDVDTTGFPLPEGASEGYAIASTLDDANGKNDGLANVYFGNLKFGMADMAGASVNADGRLQKTFRYQVRELLPEDEEVDVANRTYQNVSYDGRYVGFIVTVTDNGAGQLTYTTQKENESDDENGVSFKNEYRASASLASAGGIDIVTLASGHGIEAGQVRYQIAAVDAQDAFGVEGAPADVDGLKAVSASAQDAREKAGMSSDYLIRQVSALSDGDVGEIGLFTATDAYGGMTFSAGEGQHDVGTAYNYVVRPVDATGEPIQPAKAGSGWTHDATQYRLAIQAVDEGSLGYLHIRVYVWSSADGGATWTPIKRSTKANGVTVELPYYSVNRFEPETVQLSYTESYTAAGSVTFESALQMQGRALQNVYEFNLHLGSSNGPLIATGTNSAAAMDEATGVATGDITMYRLLAAPRAGSPAQVASGEGEGNLLRFFVGQADGELIDPDLGVNLAAAVADNSVSVKRGTKTVGEGESKRTLETYELTLVGVENTSGSTSNPWPRGAYAVTATNALSFVLVDNGDGTLEASDLVYKTLGKEVSKALFTNSFAPNDQGIANIVGYAQLVGRDIAYDDEGAGEFAFRLTPAPGSYIGVASPSDPTKVVHPNYLDATVDVEGRIDFGRLVFTAEDLNVAYDPSDEERAQVFTYYVEQIVPDGAVNEENVTWQAANDQQRNKYILDEGRPTDTPNDSFSHFRSSSRVAYDGSNRQVVTVRVVQHLKASSDEQQFSVTVESDAPTYENRYEPEPLAVNPVEADDAQDRNPLPSSNRNEGFAVRKQLTGRTLRPAGFQFVLTDLNSVRFNDETGDVERPSYTLTVLQDGSATLGSVDADTGAVSFGEDTALPTFTQAGVYSFLLEEANTGLGGVTYDGRVYPITATVSDDNGQLSCKWKVDEPYGGAVAYDDETGEALGGDYTVTDNTALFQNEYNVSRDVAPLATLTLHGRDQVQGGFTFLAVDKEYFNSDQAQDRDSRIWSVGENSSGTAGASAPVRFDSMNLSTRVLNEAVSGDVATTAISDDGTKRIWCLPLFVFEERDNANLKRLGREDWPGHVSVTQPAVRQGEYPGFWVTIVAVDDERGNLQTRVVSGDAKADDYKATGLPDGADFQLAFENTFTVDQVASSLTGDTHEEGRIDGRFPVRVAMENRDLEASELTFNLTARSNDATIVGTNDADGAVSFDAVAFTAPGEYGFDLTPGEVTNSHVQPAGAQRYTALAIVEHNYDEHEDGTRVPDGTLNVTWKVYKGQVYSDFESADEVDEALFEYLYSGAGSWVPSGVKKLDGRPMRSDVSGGGFSFKLVQLKADGNPVTNADGSSRVVATGTNQRAAVGEDDVAESTLVWTEGDSGTRAFSQEYSLEDLTKMVGDGLATVEGEGADRVFTTYYRMRETNEGSMGAGHGVSAVRVSGIRPTLQGYNVSLPAVDFDENWANDNTFKTGYDFEVKTRIARDGSLESLVPTITFENAYKATPASVTVSGKNAVTDPFGVPASFIKESYTFTLTGVDGAPVRTAADGEPNADGALVAVNGEIDKTDTHKAVQNVTFEDSLYFTTDDMAGAPWRDVVVSGGSGPVLTTVRTATFTYTVTETEQGQAGFTPIGGTAHTVEVTVTDDGQGALSATVSKVDGSASFSFENAYTATPASTGLYKGFVPTGDPLGSVKLSGRTLDAQGGEFSYRVTPLEGAPLRLSADGAKEDSRIVTNAVPENAATSGEAAIDFGPIVFVNDDMVSGDQRLSTRTFKYEIAPELPAGAVANGDGTSTAAGVTYGAQKYYAVATVSDNSAKGSLEVSWKLTDAKGAEVEALPFENTYNAEGSFVVRTHKVLNGRPMRANGFWFNLSLVSLEDLSGFNENERVEYNQTRGNYAAHAIGEPARVNFTDMKFTLAQLEGAVSREGGSRNVSFDEKTGSYTLHFRLTELRGYDEPTASGTTSHPWPDGVQPRFDEDGTIVGHTNFGADDDMPYYLVDVVVNDNRNGTLSFDVRGPQGLYLDQLRHTDPYVQFTNDYVADDSQAVVSVGGSTELVGRDLPVQSDEFTFALYPVTAGAPAATRWVTMNGSDASFDLGTITFTNDDLGTLAANPWAGAYETAVRDRYFVYRIVESTLLTGITRDNDKYFTVRLRDDGHGTLTALAKPGQLTTARAFDAASVSGTSDFKTLFTNLYATRSADSSPTAEAAGSVSVKLQMTGRDWRDTDEFSFSLTENGGNGRLVKSTSIDPETGDVQLDEVSFTYLDLLENGVHQHERDIPFTLKMDASTIPGVQADSQEATLVAHVVDNGDATVTVSWTVGYPGPDASAQAQFTAHYSGSTASGADVVLRATAELRGRAIVNNTSFRYQLRYADATTPVKTVEGDEVSAVTLPYRAASSTKTSPFVLAELGYTSDYLVGLVEAGLASVETAADGTRTYTVGYAATCDEERLPSHVEPADSPSWRGVAVTVVDDGGGTLLASAAYDGGGTTANFVYDYVARNALNLYAQAKMHGRALQAGELMYGVRLLPLDSAPAGTEPLDILPGADALDDASPYAKNATAAAEDEFCEPFLVDSISIDRDQLVNSWLSLYASKDSQIAEIGTYSMTFEIYQVSKQGAATDSVKLPQGVTVEEPTVTVRVDVADDLDGNLRISQVYGDGSTTCAQFSNEYATQRLDIPAVVRATTQLDGRAALATDAGRFKLALYYGDSDERATDADGALLPAAATSVTDADGELLADGAPSPSVVVGQVRFTPEFLDKLVADGHAELVYSENGDATRTRGTVVYEVHYAVRQVAGEGDDITPVKAGDSLGAGISVVDAAQDIAVSVTVTDGKPELSYVWYVPGVSALNFANKYEPADAEPVSVRAAAEVAGGGAAASADFAVTTSFANADGKPVSSPAVPGKAAATVSGVADASQLSADEFPVVYELQVTPDLLDELVEAGLATKAEGTGAGDSASAQNTYEFYLNVSQDGASLPDNVKALSTSALVKVVVTEDVSSGKLSTELAYLDSKGEPTQDNRPAVLANAYVKASDGFTLAATKRLYEQAASSTQTLVAAQATVGADGSLVVAASSPAYGAALDLAQGRFRFTARYLHAPVAGSDVWTDTDVVATTGENAAASAGNAASIGFTPLSFGYASGTAADGAALVDVRWLVNEGLAVAVDGDDGSTTYTVKLRVTEDKLAGDLPASGVIANSQEFDVTLTLAESIGADGVSIACNAAYGAGSAGGSLPFVNVAEAQPAPAPVDIAGASIADIPAQAFSGSPATPAVSVSYNGVALTEGTDYWVEYSGNAGPGIATVTVHGMGSYTGTAAKAFEVRSSNGVWQRLSGDLALDTMAAIVRAGDFGTGGMVVLATFDGYWDALTAAGIAGFADAPVLMTSPSGLSAQTRDLLAQLRPSLIVVAGGTAAVSDAVAIQAASAAGNAEIVRAAGETATGTAVRISQVVAERGLGSWSRTAFVATNDGYWDALAAAPISYDQHIPIFLSEGSSRLSDETLAAMKGKIDRVYIVGGTAAVSSYVEQQLAASGIKVAGRLAGANAVQTSQAVAEFGLSLGMSANHMGVATVNGYWDALSGSALCGHMSSVLVLVDGESASTIGGFVKSNAASIYRGYVFGGNAAVSDAAFAALEAATAR